MDQPIPKRAAPEESNGHLEKIVEESHGSIKAAENTES